MAEILAAGPSRWRPWFIVGAGFAALAVSFAARGALSLIMPLWQAQFGWSRGFVSSVIASAMLVMAAVAPLAGSSVDRFGPRALLTGGLAMLAVGLLLIASIPNGNAKWMLVVAFSVIGAIGFGIVAQHVVATSIATRFRSRVGLATGIGTSGSTGGQLLLVPLLAIAFEAGYWRSAFVAMGIAALLLIPVLFAGLRQSTTTDSDVGGETGGTEPMLLSRRIGALARSPVYHALFWSYLLCGFTTTGVIETHFVPYAAYCGFPPVLGASAYAMLSGVNLVGMILAGWLSDRMNRPLLLAAIYLCRALCFVLLLYIPGSDALLIIFSVLFGLFDYATVPVTASLLGTRMGIASLGLSMGILSAGHAVGGAAGAFAGGWLFDRTGGYDLVWYLSIALAVTAGFLAISVKDARQKYQARAV
ncbi:MFS transporter [Burkholderia anthina]|uniref:MFS transporter n=1 Tax=Burkholderia anthina TaxID=179879 RepID=UPI00075A7726|nr:MFS transporter [Burkholderia anthina]KVN53114.1 MFS transporter [Burkholderia anthina]